MSRRRALPAAAELFPATDGTGAAPALATVTELTPSQAPGTEPAAPAAPVARTPGRRRAALERRPTGREKHDEKITVYVSAEELVDLERARLTLRADHGLAVDRGRIVREALSVVLADLAATGDRSILVRRLRGR